MARGTTTEKMMEYWKNNPYGGRRYEDYVEAHLRIKS